MTNEHFWGKGVELEGLSNNNIFLIGPISQPRWHPGNFDLEKKESLSDKFRGDSIIENLKMVSKLGYSAVGVYSNQDNTRFISALNEVANHSNGLITLRKQEIPGYSQSRRESIQIAQNNPNCKVMIMWEAEKPLIQHVPTMIKPILDRKAVISVCYRGIKTLDNVIDDRPQMPGENLAGLPDYQARSENAFNVWANKYLRENQIMKPDTMDIDFMEIEHGLTIPN